MKRKKIKAFGTEYVLIRLSSCYEEEEYKNEISEHGTSECVLAPSRKADIKLLGKYDENSFLQNMFLSAYFLVSLHGMPLSEVEIELDGKIYIVEYKGGEYKIKAPFCKQKHTDYTKEILGCNVKYSELNGNIIFGTSRLSDFDFKRISAELLLSAECNPQSISVYEKIQNEINIILFSYGNEIDIIKNLISVISEIKRIGTVRCSDIYNITISNYSFRLLEFTDTHFELSLPECGINHCLEDFT